MIEEFGIENILLTLTAVVILLAAIWVSVYGKYDDR